MGNFVRPEDYFDIIEFKNYKDEAKAENIRKQIDDQEDYSDKIKIVQSRRSKYKYVIEDYNIFGIPKDAKVIKGYDDNEDGNDNIKFHDIKFKKHKHKFRKFKNILIAILCIVLVFNVVSAVEFFIGIGDIFGQTPFTHDNNKIESAQNYSKCFVDDQGNNCFLPGVPVDYTGYAEEHEKKDLWENDREAYNKKYGYYETDENGNKKFVVPEYTPKIFKSSDYGKSDSDRGIGQFVELKLKSDKLTLFQKLFKGSSKKSSDDNITDYVISLRWEYVAFYIQQEKDAENTNTDLVDEADNMESNTSYKEDESNASDYLVDDHYKELLINKRIMIINPENNKSIICKIGDDDSDSYWSYTDCVKNSDDIMSNVLGAISKKAAKDLGYDFSSGKSLDLYWVPDDDSKNGVYDGNGNFVTWDNFSSKYSGMGINDVVNDMGLNNDEDIEKLISNGDIASCMKLICSTDGSVSQKYLEALNKYWKSASVAKEYTRCCAASVSLAIEMSGVDSNFVPQTSVSGLKNELDSNSKWTCCGHISKSELRAGDVLIFKSSTASHTTVITGNGKMGAGSYSSNSLGSAAHETNIYEYLSGTGYVVYRMNS